MNARRALLACAAAAIGCALALVPAGSASAGGSDGATPYVVDPAGIALVGVAYPDNGHVNIRTADGDTYGLHFESKCITRTDAECAGARHDAAQYIGQAFIPWSAFGLDPAAACVEWVQVSLYNEHHGEGGQSPVGNGCSSSVVVPEPEPVVERPALPAVGPAAVSAVASAPQHLAVTGWSPAQSWLLVGGLLSVFVGWVAWAMSEASRVTRARHRVEPVRETQRVELAPKTPAAPRYRRSRPASP